MNRPKIREVIVVEGRYDKHALCQVVDAAVLTLDGFAVFRQRERVAYLRRLAERRGVILLTDSDGAGFVLRGFLKGALPKNCVKQAYIPEIPGKERRKRVPGKAGLLGVEGMPGSVLLDALRAAGATFLDGDPPETAGREPLTKADLMELGLSGGRDSARRRKALLKALHLPEQLNANALLEALNLLYDREALASVAASLGFAAEQSEP